MNNKICKNLTKILIILIIASFLGTQGQIVYGMSFGGGEFPPAPSGGGGGGGIATVNGYYGIGGNYGGGNVGMYKYGNSVTVTTATAGQANSGGGGGGGHGSYLNGGGTAVGGAGGSGIILLRFH